MAAKAKTTQLPASLAGIDVSGDDSIRSVVEIVLNELLEVQFSEQLGLRRTRGAPECELSLSLNRSYRLLGGAGRVAGVRIGSGSCALGLRRRGTFGALARMSSCSCVGDSATPVTPHDRALAVSPIRRDRSYREPPKPVGGRP